MADRTDTMKTKIEISGEKEYRDACKSINAGLREVASEMKLVTAQYADNADSTEALTAKAAVLNKQLVEEQNKVAAAEAALKRMVSEGLEPTDPAYQKMQANLNNNKAAMLDTERAISKNADALNELSEEASGAAQEIEETGDASEKSSGKFESSAVCLEASERHLLQLRPPPLPLQ